MKVWLKILKRPISGPGSIGICRWMCVAAGLLAIISLAIAGTVSDPRQVMAAESAGIGCPISTRAIGSYHNLAMLPLTAGTEGKSILPEWPDKFGPPHDIVRASRWPGYKAVMGPDSNIWCITLDNSMRSKKDFVLTRVTRGMDVYDRQEITSLEGDIVNFDVAAGTGEVILAWLEKRGDEFYLLVKEIRWLPKHRVAQSGLSYAEGSVSLMDTREFLVIKSVATDVAVSVSNNRIFIGWVDQEEGRPGAFVCEMAPGRLEEMPVDAQGRTLHEPEGPDTGPAGPLVLGNGAGVQGVFAGRTRLSDPGVSVSSLRLAPAPEGVWIAWVQTGAIVNQVIARAWADGSIGPEVMIMNTADDDARGVSMLISDDGICHLVFTQGRVLRGGVGCPVVVYGALTQDGSWIAEPVSITQGEGYVIAPSADFSNDALETAWSDNRDGKLQIYHALIQIPVSQSSTWHEGVSGSSSQPVIASYGAATLSSKECIYPQIFAFDDGVRGILYQVYLSEGDMLLQGVSTVDPREPTWAYYLGLDLERPVQDGCFKLVNGIAAALVAVFLAIPSLAAGVAVTAAADKLKVFSETMGGTVLRLLFLFCVIFMLKQPGVWFYLFAPVLPGWMGWLSFVLTSGAAMSLCLQSGSNYRDFLFTVLAGALFVFYDSVFSIIVKGVGFF